MIDPLLFALFALTLLGIAVANRFALRIAATGLIAILTVRTTLTPFHLGAHLLHEWRILLNLAGLLLGFALLANYFDRSNLPRRMTELLPGGRRGAFALLVLIALLSAVVDNIAAALIGGAAARAMFGQRVHTGYLAAIVAASNAGGACSVVGDTTTTMMWLAGAAPHVVATAGVGAAVALLVSGWFAVRQQVSQQPAAPHQGAHTVIDHGHLVIVVAILLGAILGNVLLGMPAFGVWIAILLGARLRAPAWHALGRAAQGTAFLLCLVLCASLMPIDRLPHASPTTTVVLGLVSACFDNIPLTKLAIDQDGYDWGLLAFAVGYGGSMLWFGSSAGVALSGAFPQARSVRRWLRDGWHVAVAYVIAVAVMLLLLGFHPTVLGHRGN